MPAIKTEGLSCDIGANPFTTAAQPIAGKRAPNCLLRDSAASKTRQASSYRVNCSLWGRRSILRRLLQVFLCGLRQVGWQEVLVRVVVGFEVAR